MKNLIAMLCFLTTVPTYAGQLNRPFLSSDGIKIYFSATGYKAGVCSLLGYKSVDRPNEWKSDSTSAELDAPEVQLIPVKKDGKWTPSLVPNNLEFRIVGLGGDFAKEPIWNTIYCMDSITSAASLDGFQIVGNPFRHYGGVTGALLPTTIAYLGAPALIGSRYYAFFRSGDEVRWVNSIKDKMDFDRVCKLFKLGPAVHKELWSFNHLDDKQIGVQAAESNIYIADGYRNTAIVVALPTNDGKIEISGSQTEPYWTGLVTYLNLAFCEKGPPHQRIIR